MKKVETYYVKFKFRTGQSMHLTPDDIQVIRINNSPGNKLYVDGVAVARVGTGSPNFDMNNNFYLYNCTPTQALYVLMPEDWDKTQPSLKVIDEIYVRANITG